MITNMNFERLVIAAYRLPFKFTKTESGFKAEQNSGGLVSAILALSENFKKSSRVETEKIVWAGIGDGLPENIPDQSLENESFDIKPVFLPDELNDLFYGGFSNDLIWPLFHYFTSYCVYNPEYYDAYYKANERFCDELVKTIRPGDFVWIHDYQLMLLPEMIRKRVPDVNIGFFLHIPFPSFEIFRLLPRTWRESIIKGILGADLAGFHTHDYTQNFIKCVKRTTGFECHQNIIYTPNKLVKADAFPIGIDFNKFNSACHSEGVLNEKIELQATISDQKLIFSVDRLDYSKGIQLRLKGLETFLEKYPEWHQKVVFNMVIVPSRDSIEKYKDMKREIEGMVGRINGMYSSLAWQPIVYQYRSLSFEMLIAMYNLSDVCLITPLRDGMNLVAKEFVACQTNDIGVLVLSEMAGAAAELNECLLINPVDNNEIADSLNLALMMPDAEKLQRITRMQYRISHYDVFTWATDFLNETFDIKKQQKMMNVKFVNAPILSNITSQYNKAASRIIFLDYDGTLVPFQKFPELAVIDDDTRDVVKRLTRDKKNKVVIISGRNKDFLEKQFDGVAVTLVAEHGYFIKEIGEAWQESFQADANWKEAVLPIFDEYVSRCNGTFIEQKTGSIAWHYRNADSDFALLRLHELRDDLAEIIRHKTDFEILEGHKVLEVKSGKYDKGEAVTQLLKLGNYDFVFAAGDDKTDEFMFKAIPEGGYSIRVGLSPSIARYNVADIPAFMHLIKSLV